MITRTPIPTDLAIRSIKVQENRQRVFLGLVLTEDNRLLLLRSGGYELVELPTEGYDADTMDYKLLLNPVHPTAVFGNDKVVKAVAMTPDYIEVAKYKRPVPGTSGMLHERISKLLFPFALSLAQENSGYLAWRVTSPGFMAVVGNLLAVGALLLFGRIQRIRPARMISQIALVAFTGTFGLLAVTLVPWPQSTR